MDQDLWGGQGELKADLHHRPATQSIMATVYSPHKSNASKLKGTAQFMNTVMHPEDDGS